MYRIIWQILYWFHSTVKTYWLRFFRNYLNLEFSECDPEYHVSISRVEYEKVWPQFCHAPGHVKISHKWCFHSRIMRALSCNKFQNSLCLFSFSLTHLISCGSQVFSPSFSVVCVSVSWMFFWNGNQQWVNRQSAENPLLTLDSFIYFCATFHNFPRPELSNKAMDADHCHHWQILLQS